MISLPDRQRVIACIDFVELVTDYAEGTLSARLRGQIDKHLAGCDGCESYLQQMRLVCATAGSIDFEAMPAEVLERLMTAFRASRAQRG